MSEKDEDINNIIITEYKMKYLFTSFDQIAPMPTSFLLTQEKNQEEEL